MYFFISFIVNQEQTKKKHVAVIQVLQSADHMLTAPLHSDAIADKWMHVRRRFPRLS